MGRIGEVDSSGLTAIICGLVPPKRVVMNVGWASDGTSNVLYLVGTQFPQAFGLAESWDPDAMSIVGSTTAKAEHPKDRPLVPEAAAWRPLTSTSERPTRTAPPWTVGATQEAHMSHRRRSIEVIAALLMLCVQASAALGRQTARMTVSPGEVLTDERFDISVEGLEPGETITLRADGGNGRWHSSADFRSDARGRVTVEDLLARAAQTVE